MEDKNNQEYNSMVNTNTMLLSFEGWIKYIEGFSRGLQTTKTVDALTVFDCIGEIMEYMKTLKGQIVDILIHCEESLEKSETVNEQYESLQDEVKQLTEQNKKLQDKVNDLKIENEDIKNENAQLRQAVELLEKNNGKM